MTYEYVCEACGHQWEAEQSIKDSPLKNCVSCGEIKAKRLISGGTGFLLKGGGWYADLYSSPAAAKAKGGTDDAAAKTGDTTEAKPSTTEAKPSTTEAKPSTTEKATSTGAAASSSSPAATPVASSAKKAS
jgi:putative FmdB family regulatory protein